MKKVDCIRRRRRRRRCMFGSNRTITQFIRTALQKIRFWGWSEASGARGVSVIFSALINVSFVRSNLSKDFFLRPILRFEIIRPVRFFFHERWTIKHCWYVHILLCVVHSLPPRRHPSYLVKSAMSKKKSEEFEWLSVCVWVCACACCEFDLVSQESMGRTRSCRDFDAQTKDKETWNSPKQSSALCKKN